jgi:hypothetical protein
MTRLTVESPRGSSLPRDDDLTPAVRQRGALVHDELVIDQDPLRIVDDQKLQAGREHIAFR